MSLTPRAQRPHNPGAALHMSHDVATMKQCNQCGGCDDVVVNKSYKGQVLCRGCENATEQMKKWLCPRGAPPKSCDPDINEWVIVGNIPEDNGFRLAHVDNVQPLLFIDPWVVLNKKRPSSLETEDGVYQGYLGSLLISLHFQNQNDPDFMITMKNAEDLFSRSVFSSDDYTAVYNPFRFEIWNRFFEGDLKIKLEKIFPLNLKLSYETFKESSNRFCDLISKRIGTKDNPDKNQKRIAKYLGSIWTLNSIRSMLPNFDDYMTKFRELLRDIKGSELNTSYMFTPPSNKKPRISGNLPEEVPMGLSCVSMIDMSFESPGRGVPRGTSNYQGSLDDEPDVHDDADWEIKKVLDELYRKIFKDRRLQFKNQDFQERIMQEWNRLQRQELSDEDIQHGLMKFVITSGPLSDYVNDCVKKGCNEVDIKHMITTLMLDTFGSTSTIF